MYRHIPVMLSEAMQYLNPQLGETILDCTLGGGGYTFEIAQQIGKTGRMIAIDLDETAINNAKLKIAETGVANISLYHANFRELAEVVESELNGSSDTRLDGVIFDLGLSSAQLDDSDRGFSFNSSAPLNMAFGSLISARRTEDLINLTPVSDLARLIREYGEERFALAIAKSIDKARREKKIETTEELVAAISRAVPGFYRRMRLHFATRTFQALRIATNGELENLQIALANLKPILKSGARIVVISFHSLEDRMVKNFFRSEARDCICPPEVPVCACDHKAWLEILTKKAITASAEESTLNPRARSAKLRAARVL